MSTPITVILLSKEGERFPVPLSVTRQSVYLSSIENFKDGDEIPLPTLSSPILALIIKYMTYYDWLQASPPKIEKPLKTCNLSELLPQWDCEFVNLPHETLFELILGANYLDIPGLLELSSVKVASMIKGKTPEEIRRTFNIVNSFTPEEEEQIRLENRWAEEL